MFPLAKLPWFGHAETAVLVGLIEPEDRERTAAAGFDIHVGKPIDPERLVELLRRLQHPAGAAS